MIKLIKYKITTDNDVITSKEKALFTNDKISYKEKDILVKFNYKTKELYRKSKEFEMSYNFEKETAKIVMDNYTLKPELKLVKYKDDNKNLFINFKIEETNIIYEIEVIK